MLIPPHFSYSSYTAHGKTISEYDIRITSPTSAITQIHGQISSLISPSAHSILYTASQSEFSAIYGFADAGGMWTQTGFWKLKDGEGRGWSALSGLSVGGHTFFGMTGNHGVVLLKGSQQNMKWACMYGRN